MVLATTFGGAIAAAGKGPGRLRIWAVVATVSFVCYILARVVDGRAGMVFSVFGVGACGWAWLVSRALFDPAERDARWAPIVAAIVAVSGGLSELLPAGGMTGRVAGNIYALSGSAALLLTFVEPFQRYRRELLAVEKRFRFAFVAVYAVLVAASILGLRASSDADQDNLIKGACAVIGLAALLAEVWFREAHPLAARPARRAPTEDDARLAERLKRLLAEEAIDSLPDLKIGDVAARLGEAEHRVSQGISAGLGFSNFNRWINHHRIARAKAMLANPDERRAILEIAFDCGFASLGPFNRAFRDEVGATPRAYRAEMREKATTSVDRVLAASTVSPSGARTSGSR